jgi:hypothetical protein
MRKTAERALLLASSVLGPSGAVAARAKGQSHERAEEAEMVVGTEERVRKHTAARVNQKIHQSIEASVAYYALHREEIDQRLRDLDLEWDIERTLEANASGIAFLGIMLGAFVDRRWLVVPAAVTGFLMQHAVQGWCPPLALFRKRGVRTAGEIALERFALKALRGDFDQLDADGAGEDLDRVVQELIHAIRR